MVETSINPWTKSDFVVIAKTNEKPAKHIRLALFYSMQRSSNLNAIALAAC